MYSDRVPRFVIDLEDEESERWRKVIAADWKAVEKLAEEAEEDYEGIPSILRAGLGVGYRISGGRYQDELQAWADVLERPFGDVVLMNCAYELSHAAVGVFGCTAGIRWLPDLGPVHVRSLDWPLRNIGRVTRIFEYQEGKRSFLAVGISGFVGVLSGMLPGAYSATINWAPPEGRPTFDFGPAFLLREVFETCDTYEDAVYTLTHTTLSAPVFFTICGTKKDEACIIERTHARAAVRKIKGPVLVQANHHVAPKFVANNDDEELLECSQERAETLERALTETSATSLDEVATCLDEGRVCNEDSFQQMVFCPKTGGMSVWRWID